MQHPSSAQGMVTNRVGLLFLTGVDEEASVALD